MSPPAIEPSFPLEITLLCYIATGALVVILLLLMLINSKLSKLSKLSANLSRSSRDEKVEDTDASRNAVEVQSGTNFEEFLKEDPERHKLSKNEQFKAYRAWRSERGLNWSK